ncbi:unnamed protein product [Toxocara canis]|uniref:Uncharacterized protein n=1 Tax=Toxocara canis TaxID=6265 RepID=A0A3P7F4S3_TOXCA|nr:unnamed protein product [Toxocara canis]
MPRSLHLHISGLVKFSFVALIFVVIIYLTFFASAFASQFFYHCCCDRHDVGQGALIIAMASFIRISFIVNFGIRSASDVVTILNLLLDVVILSSFIYVSAHLYGVSSFGRLRYESLQCAILTVSAFFAVTIYWIAVALALPFIFARIRLNMGSWIKKCYNAFDVEVRRHLITEEDIEGQANIKQ